jgi:hypothetical protein
VIVPMMIEATRVLAWAAVLVLAAVFVVMALAAFWRGP